MECAYAAVFQKAAVPGYGIGRSGGNIVGGPGGPACGDPHSCRLCGGDRQCAGRGKPGDERLGKPARFDDVFPKPGRF
jgi:hypothetical protein